VLADSARATLHCRSRRAGVGIARFPESRWEGSKEGWTVVKGGKIKLVGQAHQWLDTSIGST
jgi:hypothetical protein